MTISREQPEELDPRLAQAISQLVPGAVSAEAVAARPFVARVVDDSGVSRVRLWPAGTTEARVRFAQTLSTSVLTGTLADQHGWVLIDGMYVERQPWRPGASLVRGRERRLPDGHALHIPQPLESTPERRLIQALAHCHRAAATIAADPQAPIAPVDRILRIVQTNWREARERLRPIAREHPPVQRWFRVGEQLLPAAEEAITAAAPSFGSPVVAHLALWPGHAIDPGDGGEVALIDFSMAAVTSALFDVAQIVTRFNGWTGQAAERVLGEYSDGAPLGPDERRVLPAVAAFDLVIEAGRLLAAGYGRGPDHASNVSQAARAGALHTLDSMDALHPAVVRATERVPYAKRRRLSLRDSSAPRGRRRDR